MVYNFYFNWTEFCGTEEGFVVWDTIHNDIGFCCQALCLHLPALSLIAIVSSHYCGKLTDWVVRPHRDMCILRIRYCVALLLSCLPIVRSYVEVSNTRITLFPINHTLAAVESFSWFIHFIYILALRHRLGPSLRGPVFMNFIWMLNYALSFMTLRSYYIICKEINFYRTNTPLTFAFIRVVLQTIYALTLIPSSSSYNGTSFYQPLHNQNSENSPLLNAYSRFREDLDPGYLGTAEEGWGIMSRLFFSWVQPMMTKGAMGGIQTPDDLYDLPTSLTSAHLHHKLYSAMIDYSLFKGLHRSFWKEFYGIGILKLLSDAAGFCGPLLLNRLVNFIEDRKFPEQYGYLYAAGLFTSSLTLAFCISHFNYLMGKVGLRIRGALITVIYRKTLTLNTVSLKQFSLGEIVNFMSTDTDRIVGACPSFHALWSLPFQIAVTLYLLYLQVGISFIAGLLFTIILIPINKLLATWIGNISVKMMEQKDERVKITSEVLRGIRVVKLHVWEDFFIEKILKIRKKEMYYLKGRKYLDAMCVYFWATTPVLISLLTFLTYTLLGNELTAATVFTSIALFNMLISPLNAFPWVLNGLTEAWVSLNRIQLLLEKNEVDIYEYYSHLPSVDVGEGALAIKSGQFHWGRSYFKLYDINIAALKGQFIGITGQVGSGKSSLLAAVLAEMEKDVGFVAVPEFESGFGFVSQTPWLQNGTLRDNVLFGKPLDQTRYRTVLDACALTEDLMSLPGGDLVSVGEGGSSLSGGQKARVALARAVYQDRSIYLLDDILSAVDARVARHIFHFCINGLLSEKTRILCTHQTQFLLNADQVIVMEGGTILNHGQPAEVLSDYEDCMTQSQLESSEIPPAVIDKNISTTQKLPSPPVPQDEELSARGTVAWKVYNRYLAAVGYGLTLIILLSIILMQVSRNATDWWLALWVTESSHFNLTTGFGIDWKWEDDTPTMFYLQIYAAIAGLNTLFTFFRAFLFAWGGITAAIHLHKALLKTVVRAQVVFFDVTPLGRILNRFSSDTYTIDDSLPFISNILLAQFFGLLGTVSLTIYGLPWLSLLLLPLIPVYHWLQNHYRLTSRELKRLSTISLSPLYTHFTETLQGLTTIRAFRANARFHRQNESILESNQKVQLASLVGGQWLGLRLQLIGVAMVTGVSVLSVLEHQYKVANPGLVGLAISYILGVTAQLGGVVNAFTETEREMVSVERVDQTLRDTLLEEQHERVTPPYAWPSQGVIVFKNVFLRYRQYLMPSLKGVTFSTRPAERIGIVGRTGAGKSSLLAAMFRLVEVNSGEILVDAVNIAHIGLCHLRSRLGVIPQEVFLFSGSVRENLDPGNVFQDAELWSALERCHLSNVIQDLGGLSAMIAPGSSISHGQAQLLCLARAILKNAKILCIDEATASVDEITDRQIQDTIRTSFRLCTVLTIAHRIRTIMDSDRVLVMGNGEVLEFDTPENLLDDKNSHFYRLVHKEFH
ncbi:ATP-binding cassette sub-family C member 10 [Lycorma delicatula]|uniref:ATP-binding cassette sub-family C member 10 n=1 Tax=Lycorma delicatula TaxID=130591 RepID=UPI003F5193E9